MRICDCVMLVRAFVLSIYGFLTVPVHIEMFTAEPLRFLVYFHFPFGLSFTIFLYFSSRYTWDQ